MKILFTILFTITFLNCAFTQTCTVSGSGDWDNVGCNEGGNLGSSSLVIIPSGVTVTSHGNNVTLLTGDIEIHGKLIIDDQNVETLGNVIIEANGELEVTGKLNIGTSPGCGYNLILKESTSKVTVPGNASDKIRICDNEIIRGGSSCVNPPPYCTGPSGGSISGPIGYDEGGENNSLLPVELITFKVTNLNEKAIVTWETAAELNNDFFTIQRSKDGANFEDIGTVAGMGTTNQPQTYTFTDENPLAGTSYYRLKQTDFDGTTEIFKPVLFEMISSSSHITVFPNPVSGNKFKININGISNSAYLKILNLHGEEIYNQLVNNARNEELTINQVSIKPGIYIAILYTNLQQETFKFVKK